MKKHLAAIICLLISVTASAQGGFDRGIVKSTFVPKGTWFFGGTASYTQHSNENYQFLLLKDWDGSGYTGSIKPFVGWCFADNIGVGLSVSYERSMLHIKELNLSLTPEMNFTVQDCFSLTHMVSGTAFLRTYINIGESKRFGLYNDLKFMYGKGQGRLSTGLDESMTGTYQDITQAGILLSPGMVVFIDNFVAVEASVGILGFQYKNIKQTTNQVYEGSRTTNGATFKIDLLSIGLGISFYL